MYLLSGYLKKEETDGAAKGQDGEDKMDVDGEDGTQATQQTQADGTESVRVKTMALVQEDELEGALIRYPKLASQPKSRLTT